MQRDSVSLSLDIVYKHIPLRDVSKSDKEPFRPLEKWVHTKLEFEECPVWMYGEISTLPWSSSVSADIFCFTRYFLMVRFFNWHFPCTILKTHFTSWDPFASYPYQKSTGKSANYESKNNKISRYSRVRGNDSVLEMSIEKSHYKKVSRNNKIYSRWLCETLVIVRFLRTSKRDILRFPISYGSIFPKVAAVRRRGERCREWISNGEKELAFLRHAHNLHVRTLVKGQRSRPLFPPPPSMDEMMMTMEGEWVREARERKKAPYGNFISFSELKEFFSRRRHKIQLNRTNFFFFHHHCNGPASG